MRDAETGSTIWSFCQNIRSKAAAENWSRKKLLVIAYA